MLDFESKLVDVLSARNWFDGSADSPFDECFGGVELNSMFEGLMFCVRFGSATAVACIMNSI